MKQFLLLFSAATLFAQTQPTVMGSRTVDGNWDASGAIATKPAKSGTALPAACSTGEAFFKTNAAAGQNLYLCMPDNTWTQVSNGVSSVFGRSGAVTPQTGDYTFSQVSGTVGSSQLPAAGGDLSGGITAATVTRIQGQPVGTTAPGNGQVLTWSGSQWVAQSVAGGVSSVFGRSGAVTPQTGDYTFSQVSGTVGSSQLPAAGGDLSGGITAATVTRIQGQPVGTTAPGSGQVLTWNGSQWMAQTAPGGSGGSAVLKQLVFDGSTMISGETMTAWSCGSGSGAVCSTSWTAPSGVYWVQVQAWSGGGGGSGSRSADRSGAGGGGGGYWEAACPVSPGNVYTVTLGLGGAFSTDGYVAAGNGGNSGLGGCFTLAGAVGGNSTQGAAFGGKLGTSGAYWGWETQNTGLATIASGNWCAGGGTPGPHSIRSDGGGCGAGNQGTSGSAGFAGGSAIGGAGGGASGGYNNATAAPGGTSGFGGAGGNGGGWTLAGGPVPCTAGGIPGGGGGGAAATVTGNGNQNGCNGARGELRVYYVH